MNFLSDYRECARRIGLDSNDAPISAVDEPWKETADVIAESQGEVNSQTEVGAMR
jgi:hypothetical protein